MVPHTQTSRNTSTVQNIKQILIKHIQPENV